MFKFVKFAWHSHRYLSSKTSWKVLKSQEVLLALNSKGAVNVFIDALNDNWCVRYEHAIEALGSLRDSRAIEPLCRLLDRRTARVAEALGKIGDKRAVGPLINALRKQLSKFDSSSILEIVQALVVLKAFPKREVISKVLMSRGDTPAVIEALGTVGHPSVVEPLISLLASTSLPIRQAAARALIFIANSSPDWIGWRWLQVKKLVEEPMETHEDPIYEDTQTPSRSSTGIGLIFPDGY